MSGEKMAALNEFERNIINRSLKDENVKSFF